MNEAAAAVDTPQAAPSAARRRAGWWRLAVLLVLVAGLVVAVKFLPVKQYLDSVLRWAEGLGVWGPIVVAGIYIGACVVFLPGSVLTLGAGFLFGVLKGTVTVSIGSTLGACAAFLVGRTVARDWVTEKVADNAKFAAIDEAVGQQGFKIVLLTRLSPIFPFNMLNYAFGLTRVRFGHYALASWVGMLPGTVMYVYLGHATRAVTQSLTDATAGPAQRGTAEQIFFWVGLAVAIAVAVFVTRIARRALQQAAPKADQPNTSEAATEGAAR